MNYSSRDRCDGCNEHPSRCTCDLVGTTWAVVGPDPVLGEPWMLLHRTGTDGTHHYDRRVERRKKETPASQSS